MLGSAGKKIKARKPNGTSRRWSGSCCFKWGKWRTGLWIKSSKATLLVTAEDKEETSQISEIPSHYTILSSHTVKLYIWQFVTGMIWQNQRHKIFRAVKNNIWSTTPLKMSKALILMITKDCTPFDIKLMF